MVSSAGKSSLSGWLFFVKVKWFSVEPVTEILKQVELGTPIAELLRRHVVSEQRYYRWKKLYAGMAPSEARKLREMREHKNVKRKRLVSDLSLDEVMLQDVLQKKLRGLSRSARS